MQCQLFTETLKQQQLQVFLGANTVFAVDVHSQLSEVNRRARLESLAGSAQLKPRLLSDVVFTDSKNSKFPWY